MNAPNRKDGIIRQLPISVRSFRKSEMRSQISALCYRLRGERAQVLLITTRRTRRWVTPKGWMMAGRTPAEAALIEAWEEAGVKGRAMDRCIGLFTYNKWLSDTESLPCAAMVYPIEVKSLAATYPERSERRRKWFSPKKAAAQVEEPELARILRDFDPRTLTGEGGF